MSKKFLRSPLKVLAATSVTIFSLLTVFTSTAAWFDSKKTFDNGANQMEVADMEAFQSIALYETIHADENNYYFGTTPVVTSNTSIPLGGTDDPFRADDPCHPLLMVIEYEAPNSNALVFASTDSSFICDTATEVSRNPLESASGNPLSSIVSFYCNGYAAAIPTTTYNAQQVYGFSTSTLKNSWTNSAFATLLGSGIVFNGRPCLYSSGETTIVRVALIIEYNVDAINFISSYYMGNELLSEDISFSCDWTLEV